MPNSDFNGWAELGLQDPTGSGGQPQNGYAQLGMADPSQSPAAQHQGGLLRPYSYDQAVQDYQNRGAAAAPAIVGHGIGNAFKGLVNGVTGAVTSLGMGGIGLGEKTYDAVTGQNHTGQWKGEQFVNAVPGALLQTAKNGLHFGKELFTDPNQALQDAASYTYQDPTSVILALSGIGDAAATGLKIAGGVGDNLALDSAKAIAGLTPEEAATASLAGTSPLTTAGNSLSELSAGINPYNLSLDAIRATKDGVGLAVRKLLGLTTGTGSDGASAIKAIAAGGDSAAPYVAGMRNASTEPGQQALTDSLSGINAKNIDNAGFMDMTPIRQQTMETLQNFGMRPVFMQPEEVQALREGLPISQAAALYEKYALAPETADVFSQVKDAMWGNRYRTTMSGPTQDQMMETLKTIANRNGYIGISPGVSSIPASTQKGLIDLAQNVFSTGGGAGGFEANAENVQRLKQLAGSLYNDSPLATPEQKAGNAAVTAIKESIDSQLKQSPDYQNAMDWYKQYYSGNNLNQFLPKNNITKGSDALGAFLLSHFVNLPAGVASIAAASPRIVGEAANAYGKTAGIYGGITSPVTGSLESAAISALLHAISGASSPPPPDRGSPQR